MDRGFHIRALGEVAIRCADLPAMTAFYRDILGLEVLSDRGAIVFFRLGESYGGHTQVLALFDHAAPQLALHAQDDIRPQTGARSSLHHVALTIDAAEQVAAERFLVGEGLPCRIEDFPWIGWRGVFTRDPEGNTVELVAKVGPARPE